MQFHSCLHRFCWFSQQQKCSSIQRERLWYVEKSFEGSWITWYIALKQLTGFATNGNETESRAFIIRNYRSTWVRWEVQTASWQRPLLMMPSIIAFNAVDDFHLFSIEFDYNVFSRHSNGRVVGRELIGNAGTKKIDLGDLECLSVRGWRNVKEIGAIWRKLLHSRWLV